ncbi:hypothetical protein J437_LFUL013160, partial [Ladona fulva]
MQGSAVGSVPRDRLICRRFCMRKSKGGKMGGVGADVEEEDEGVRLSWERVFSQRPLAVRPMVPTTRGGLRDDAFYVKGRVIGICIRGGPPQGDINECDNPVLAQRCVANAECCNLPAHFVCKCLPGFHGDGEVECLDIDECQKANACGHNARCHNLPGNYTCSCLDGFYGNPYDGCADRNECDDQNACGPRALCTNEAGGHKCHCPEGYVGDPYGREGCRDENECIARAPCGRNALCSNLEGGFRCVCPQGFVGDPFDSCTDVDECEENGHGITGPCGLGATCHNTPGSFRCECTNGHTGDPNRGCTDLNECAHSSSCGVNSQCINSDGSYDCICPPGFRGEGQLYCNNIDECKDNPCGANAVCTDVIGSFTCTCLEDYTGDPYKGCVDINECVALDKPCGKYAICENAAPGYNCVCPQGYTAKPDPSVACEQIDVNILCNGNFDCVNNAECLDGQCFCRKGFLAKGAECVDIDECHAEPCGPNAICTNTVGGFRCECEHDFVGAPPHVPCKAPCEDIKCGPHAYCKPDGNEAYCICDEGWTFNPSNIVAGCIDIDECDKVNGPSGRCGANAVCTNLPGSFSCQCAPGFSGNAQKQCFDIDECAQPNTCGLNALCINIPGSHACECPEGTIPDPDPQTRCVGIVTCKTEADCPGNAICDAHGRCLCPEPNVGNDCRHPCETISCGPNAQCTLVNEVAQCVCSPGYTGSALEGGGGCVDIDECVADPCPRGAICINAPGRFSCQCPSGFKGDPYRGGCVEPPTIPSGCGPDSPCPAGEQCVRDDFVGVGVCICQRGYTRDTPGPDGSSRCRDIDECTELREKPACGLGAVCKNLPGSYECQCPPGFNGNPYSLCEQCSTLECQCQPPYQIVEGNCALAGCSKGEKCPAGAECITIAGGVSYCACPKGYRIKQDGSCEDVNECTEIRQVCGFGAECINRPGTHECVCPTGFSGDPYHGVCSPDQIRCINDGDCQPNEKCVQPGECVCPPPFFTDALDGNKCKSPCERFLCGINAKCTPSDPPRCMCETGHQGNPLQGCIDIDECFSSPCAYGAHCINEKGGYKCVCSRGMTGDPYRSGCINQGAPKTECDKNTDCVDQLACVAGSCVNPCDKLPCGVNAYCEAQNHAAWCRCNVGFTELPGGECVSACDAFICGQGAVCMATANGPTCKCVEGYVGNPFPGGACHPDVCSVTEPCQEPSICVSGRCKERCEGVVCGVGATCDPSTNKCVCNPFFVGNPDLVCMPPIMAPVCIPECGPNAHCKYGTSNQCVCNPGMSGNPYEGCSPQEKTCSTTACGLGAECRQGINTVECVCPVGFIGNPYVSCQVACRNADDCVFGERCQNNVCVVPCAGHAQCSDNQACINGICTLGCRSHVNCPSDQACINGKCQDPCKKEGACGPNAVCKCVDHATTCLCPDGFVGNPVPEQGCVRVPIQCGSGGSCPEGYVCLGSFCALSCAPHENNCAVGERCGNGNACVKVCLGDGNCLVGEVCEEGTCQPGCHIDSDCKTSEVCVSGKCRCGSGFTPGPAGCLDIDECTGGPCHPTAECINTPGSFRCSCPIGTVGDPFIAPGCVAPNECEDDGSCGETLACRSSDGLLKCMDPCASTSCGPGAVCNVYEHAPVCNCPVGFLGDPNDPSVGCFKVECLDDDDCPRDKYCHKQNNRCMNPCDQLDCGRGTCKVTDHKAVCSCIDGYHLEDGRCRNTPGSFTCACPEGLVGNPVSGGCRSPGDCLADLDCPPTAVCINNRCGNPCDQSGVCAHGALCTPLARGEHSGGSQALCQCPPRTTGDPVHGECIPLECEESEDCDETLACVSSRCINPCSLPNACGLNAQCIPERHAGICQCGPGTTGDPRLGCVPVQYCAGDGQCPAGTRCTDGVCSLECNSARDCIGDQLCIQDVCRPTCKSNSSCPDFQYCLNNICVKEVRCRSDDDCDPVQRCALNTLGQADCINPCESVLCGRNADCFAQDHSAICTCKTGYFGNPQDDKIGCQPIECNKNEDCASEKLCEDHVCKVACLLHNPCGQNAVCAAENHVQ